MSIKLSKIAIFSPFPVSLNIFILCNIYIHTHNTQQYTIARENESVELIEFRSFSCWGVPFCKESVASHKESVAAFI